MRSEVVDAYFAAMLETIAELERDVERLTRRCAYLEEQRAVLRGERDDALGCLLIDRAFDGPLA